MDAYGKKYYDKNTDYTKFSFQELLKNLNNNKKKQNGIFNELQEWNVNDRGKTRAEYNPYYNSFMICGKTINSIEREIDRREAQENEIFQKKLNNNKKNFIIITIVMLILCVLFSNYLKKENI
jgi:hypothetical protein